MINSARAPQGGDKGEERLGRGRGGSEEGRKEEVEGKTSEGMRRRGEGEGIKRTVENMFADKVERSNKSSEHGNVQLGPTRVYIFASTYVPVL